VTDQLEDLFADLRAGTLTEIRPPGTTAARQTVRRRRTTTSVAAGAAVLAIAGGVGWLSLTESRPSPDVPVQHRSTETGDLPTAALAAVHDRVPGTTVAESAHPLRGAVLDSVVASAGRYMLFVACAGAVSGFIDVGVSRSPAGNGPGRDLDGLLTAERTVPCADPPQPILITLTLPVDGALAIELTGNPAADGTTGYAYALIAPSGPAVAADTPGMTSTPLLKAAARAVATASRDDTIAYQDAAGASSASTSYLDRGTVPPGAYVFRATCAGTGTVTISALNTSKAGRDDPTGGSVLATWPLFCSSDPAVATMHFTFAAGLIAIAARPDATARGKAAVGFSLVRS
jgi:hypothetical protein